MNICHFVCVNYLCMWVIELSLSLCSGGARMESWGIRMEREGIS